MPDVESGDFVRYKGRPEFVAPTGPSIGSIGFVYDATKWDARVLWIGYETGIESEVCYDHDVFEILSRDEFATQMLEQMQRRFG